MAQSEIKNTELMVHCRKCVFFCVALYRWLHAYSTKEVRLPFTIIVIINFLDSQEN